MLLAGDVGGTKTQLGLYEPAPRRPKEIDSHRYGTAEFATLEAMIDDFLGRQAPGHRRVRAAAFGVAGPVIEGRVKLTNVSWHVDAGELAASTGIAHVGLLNDLAALAHAVPVLDADELAVLQEGESRRDGNAALIAAGTGLGEALLHNVAGRLIPSPSEGGHADFAARTEREAALAAALTRWYGRATWESVLSGPGIVNIYRFTHNDRGCPSTASEDDPREWPGLISEAGMAGTCPLCVETLDLFVASYGAEAGNLALQSVSTFGMFVGGGIAPKILPAIKRGGFLAAFRAKRPMEALVGRMPVKVILHPRAGLLGAAVHAASLVG